MITGKNPTVVIFDELVVLKEMRDTSFIIGAIDTEVNFTISLDFETFSPIFIAATGLKDFLKDYDRRFMVVEPTKTPGPTKTWRELNAKGRSGRWRR